jgi:hypothetical protein
VTGLARVTGGQADFALDGADRAKTVIPQQALSFTPSLVELSVESESGPLQVSP